MEQHGYQIVCYVVGSFVALLFALYAFAYGWWWTKKQSRNQGTEDFVTARGSQSMLRIGWSFYAGAVGSWAIVTPSQYASFAGIIGVVVYAQSCGLPILLIGYFGGQICRDMPHVFSLADFVGWRYGPIAKTTVFLMTMFVMCIFVLAEYTTIGTIFSDFVGSVSYGIVLIIGFLTLTYTAYGGLAVSIATDQAQGIASMLLALILAIYVAVTYRTPLPKPLPENLGPNYYGYVSIFTLVASLVGSTMINEAFWQRVWASADARTLHGGAMIGYAAVVVLIFLSGFGGWLAFAGGYAVEGVTNANVYLMQILGDNSGTSLVNSWVGVLVVLLAIVMNEGAVDSLQNGLAASISGQYLKNAPLMWTRIAVVLINVPLVVIATRGFAVLALFLVGNLLSCCAIIPLIFGLMPRFRGFFSETGFVLGVLGGVLGVTGSGVVYTWDASQTTAKNWAVGADWGWYSNNYDWRPFFAALACSAAVMVVFDSCAWLLRRFAGVHGPGVSGVLMPIPGMRYLTATPHWSADGSHRQGWQADSDVQHADGFKGGSSSTAAGQQVAAAAGGSAC
uniref:Uncharacterized protein n=1 Tax=Tetradesmus obliquus TaxID=3088 RepID=A0A383WE19_TETOB|eukprot:jgi/Sobl393_1/9282/SZX75848.1